MGDTPQQKLLGEKYLKLAMLVADPGLTAMQDIDIAHTSQAWMAQATVHVPRPTAKQAWLKEVRFGCRS